MQVSIDKTRTCIVFAFASLNTQQQRQGISLKDWHSLQARLPCLGFPLLPHSLFVIHCLLPSRCALYHVWLSLCFCSTLPSLCRLSLNVMSFEWENLVHWSVI